MIKILGDLFNLILLQPAINLVILIIFVLQFFHIPGALGFSIIILTIFVSLISWPFRSSQIRAQRKMANLKPHLDELKQKHKGDKKAFAEAQMALFKEHGVNPAAGCLPSLLPIFLIYPIYQVIFAFFGGEQGLEKINYFLYLPSWHLKTIPDLHFFGINLATKPSEYATIGIPFLLIPLVTALLTFIQSKMMSPQVVKLYKTDSPKEIKEKAKEEDMSTAMQSQMVFLMPLMIGWFAFQFPVGLAIYWNTFTIMGIIQQYKISGWGGLEGLWKNNLVKH